MLYFQRFVNFGKRTWQPMVASGLAPTFQSATPSVNTFQAGASVISPVVEKQAQHVVAPVVPQQAVPSHRLSTEFSQVNQKQQARLVRPPVRLEALKKSLLQDPLLSNKVELPVRLHPEEELASRA